MRSVLSASPPARRKGRHEPGGAKLRRCPAVEAVGLGKRYGHTWGLQDCSVQVPKGAISALLGPNGSGKTTLLRMVAGFATASAGSVRVLGLVPASRTRSS